MRDGVRKSRLSQVKQDRLIEHFVACTPARCAASLIGVNRKTAAFHPVHLGVRKFDVAPRTSLHARPPEPNQFAKTTSEPTD